MHMDFELGIEYIVTAQKQNQEEMLYQRWLYSYQQDYSLEEFKKKIFENVSNVDSSDNRSEEEILANVKRIIGEGVIIDGDI